MKDADIDEDGDGRITVDELFRHVKTGARERGLPIPLRNSQHAVDSLAMAKRPRPRRKAGPAQLGALPEPDALTEVRDLIAAAREAAKAGDEVAAAELARAARKKTAGVPEGDARLLGRALVNEETRRQRSERLARERIEREKAEREARERAEREAREKAEREARERAEREAREKAEREARERAEREEQERRDREARTRPLHAYYANLARQRRKRGR
jgi:hypothetical protein